MASELVHSNSMTEQTRIVDSSHAVNLEHAPYLLFVFLISVLALLLLAVDVFVDAQSETGQILHYADTLLCVLFFADFIICFAHARDKLKYMYTWGWLDLASSIPAIEVLRWGRAARLARILRVLRGIRSARILMRFILDRRAESVGLAAVLTSIVVLAVSSIAILHLERTAGTQANICTAEDAVWWSIATITTVGYGDHYPVTTEGRCVAMALMFIGVALIGTWTGIATSWFVNASDDRQVDHLHQLQGEIQELRRLLEGRSTT